MAEVERISPEQALEKITREGFVYVDVRTIVEFEAGHPAGAHNVPFMVDGDAGLVDNPDFLRTIAARFSKDAKIVLGCQTGQRSLRAARALLVEGYAHVVDQRAGWAGVTSPFGQVKERGWRALGLPSEEGSPAGRGYGGIVE